MVIKHFLLILIVCIGVFASYWLGINSQAHTVSSINTSAISPNTDIVWFPRENPQFKAVIKKDSYTQVNQQSITIYHDNKMVFSSKKYADGFRGRVLTYTFADSQPAFIQSGDLGMIGCLGDCAFSYGNYYIWNDKTHTFVVDNTQNKLKFQNYLQQYDKLDKNGCPIDPSGKYKGLSYTAIYQQFPSEKVYCGSQYNGGVSHDTLIYFLKAKKAVEGVLRDKNVNSDDIMSIQI